MQQHEIIPLTGTQLLNRAAGIRLVVLDVDGVLSDGKITYTSDGQELKSFNVKDGLGISLGVRSGLQFAIITARQSVMVERRAQDLGIAHVIQNTRTKLPALQKLLTDLALTPQQAAYVGDDLPDLPCMQSVGLACCPGDAVLEVRATSHLVSNLRGGDGAVREIVGFILECQQALGMANPDELRAQGMRAAN